MANDMVLTPSVKHYYNKFVFEQRKDLDQPMKRAQIKLQLLDAFRREIFGQIAFNLRLDPETMNLDAIAELEAVKHILHNSFRKWRRLCMLCNDAGLINWLTLEDLTQVLEEEKAEDGHIIESGGDYDGDEVHTT